MTEGSSLDEHIDEFNKACDDLDIIDEDLSNKDKALLLISSLLKLYKHFMDACCIEGKFFPQKSLSLLLE